MAQIWYNDIMDALDAHTAFVSRLLVSEYILVVAAIIILRFDLWTWAKKVLVLLWLALCALFSFPWPALLLGMGIYINHLMTRANLYKISQNHMPITASDIAITARDPAIIFNLFGYSRRWLYPSLLALFSMVAGMLYAAAMFVAALSMTEAFALVFVLATFFAVLLYFKRQLFSDVRIHFAQDAPFGMDACDSMGWILGNWQCDSISILSRHIGVPSFLLYTHSLARSEIPEFFQKAKPQPDIPADELIQAAERYIPSLPARSEGFIAPNIVLMQCESIFDPARAFNLSGDYKNYIFTANEFTKAILPLRVNIVGGGSWISEFECVTGLDSRLFGYIGYYSHFSLSPHVVGALPTFLANRGYATNAFFAATGDFYNAQVAYHRYGFQGFYDSQALGLLNTWASSDFEMASAFVRKTHELSADPSFSYIVTNGAHSPYSPDNFWEPAQWTAMFQKECDPYMNAQLNEYLRHLGETEGAMKLILDRLVHIQKTTGRPFVFVMYGDHQPHDFTGTWNALANYEEVRSNAPKHQTFVHVMSSMEHLKLQLADEVPLTLLPSIISASVVDDYRDIYALPNMRLYEKLGSNLFPDLVAPTAFGVAKNPTFAQDKAGMAEIRTHRAADRAQAIAALKKLNIMKI